jgi:hypothetical protein
MGEGNAVGLSVSPEMLHSLPIEAQAALSDGIVAAIHPIYLIAAGLGVVGMVFSFMLKEIPLRDRRAGVSE